MNFLEQFKAARRVSTPLIAIRTPDPAATISTISQAYKDSPVIMWDIARGVSALNDAGAATLTKMMGGDDPAMLTNPVELLSRASRPGGLDRKTILFFFLAQRFLDEPSVCQAIWNLRDVFKADFRTLAMLCPAVTLPPQLAQDVLVLDEPLPTPDQLKEICREVFSLASMKVPSEAVLERAVDAGIGLAAFPAEQVYAMSLSKEGLDMDAVWERKRQQIEQTPGLSVWRGTEKFANIGGCENIKQFLSRVLEGEAKPRAIVFIDEIEKALAGAAGDLSGTSQEMLGTLLSFMQDKKASGMLFIGPPGAAKSAMAKAAGNEAGIPTISFDISGMKGSLVGESGANMRTALKLVEAVAQQRALFVATCNSIGALPPELRRRFAFGTFFFDLPSAAERGAIWKIWFAKYPSVKDRSLPDDAGWTGAEIEKCCDIAWRLGSTLKEAATYIVPVAKSAAEAIDKLRQQASGRFISASQPGLYQQRMESPSPRGRAMEVGQR